MNFPSWEHCPQGAATKPASSRFPPTRPHPKVPISYPTRTVHETSLFLQFSMEVFSSAPERTPVGVSILASTFALATVTQVSLLPPPLRKLTKAMEGKGEEILEVEREVAFTDCFLPREIPLFHVALRS